MKRRTSLMAVFAAGLACAAWAAPALAQSCGEDLQKLAQQREAAMATINGLIKQAKGKQLDPSIFCAKSSGLIAAENAMIAYMEKNKDWCGIPDETLAGLKANHVKSGAFSAKACKVAAEMKKARDQAANGGGPVAQPLPTGPL